MEINVVAVGEKELNKASQVDTDPTNAIKSINADAPSISHIPKYRQWRLKM